MELENKNTAKSPVDFYYISGLTSVLYDHDNELIRESLTSLLPIIDGAWSEISDCLPQIVYLSKDVSFPYRSLAAYVASKCFFNLHQYKESFYYALDSGNYFDYKQRNEYTETMIITCLDIYTDYIKTRNENSEPLDQRIEEIVNYIFQSSLYKDEYINIIGTAIECRDLTICKDLLLSRKDLHLLFYIEQNIIDLEAPPKEKQNLFLFLKDIYHQIDPYGYYYGLYLYKYNQLSELQEFIYSLLSTPFPSSITAQNHVPLLIAYQLASDFYLYQNKSLNRALIQYLNKKQEEEYDNENLSHWISQFTKLISGELIQDLYTDCLKYNNKYDNIYVNRIFNNLKSNVNIQAISVLTLSLMNLGTFNSPVVMNLSSRWLKNVKEWSSFLVVQSFVHIYKYQIQNLNHTYSRYLHGVSEKQGGALAGMSMAYMDKYDQIPEEVVSMAESNLNSTDEYSASGAALAFGSYALNNRTLYTEQGELDADSSLYKGYLQLINNIQGDQPTIGMYSGIALGLFLYNKLDHHMNDLFTQLYSTMENTKHKNITLGCGIGLALALYQTQETALPLLDKLLASRRELCRYSAVYIYGSAYMGTANKQAIQQVLHIMVSDRSSDVLRACPIALYLILYNEKKQLLDILLPLLDSYSSSIRHSAILAIGYLLAEGNPLSIIDKNQYKELINKFFSFLEKKDDVVNQAVYIALGFIFMGKNNKNVDRIPEYKESIVNILYKGAGSEASFVVLSCIGALLGAGIIDAGGRNVTYSLHGLNQSFDITKVFSFILFQQFWYWHCFLGYCINIFTPSCLLAVDSTLNLPKSFNLLNDTPLSIYDYYPHEESKKVNEKDKYEINKLNFSKKNYVPTISKTEEEHKEEIQVEVKEEDTYTIKSGMRVLPIQYNHIHIPKQRFIPLLQHCYPSLYHFNTNLIILYDTQPDSYSTLLSNPSESLHSDLYMKIGEDDSTKDPTTPPSFVYTIPQETKKPQEHS